MKKHRYQKRTEALSRAEAVEAWRMHCFTAGHLTVAAALSRGLTEHLRNEWARYGMTAQRIYCSQRDCSWTLELEGEDENW